MRKFKKIPAAHKGDMVVSIGDGHDLCVVREKGQPQTLVFTVAEAKALRDWLTKALPRQPDKSGEK